MTTPYPDELEMILFGKLTRRGYPDEIAHDMARAIYRRSKKLKRKFDLSVRNRGADNPHDTIMCDMAFIASMPHAENLFPGIQRIKPFFKSFRKDGQRVYTPWPARRNIYLMDDFIQIAMSFAREDSSLHKQTYELDDDGNSKLDQKWVNNIPSIDEEEYVPTMGIEDFVAFEQCEHFASPDDITQLPFHTAQNRETWHSENLKELSLTEDDLEISYDGWIDSYFEVAGVRVINENGTMKALVTAYAKNKFSKGVLRSLMRCIDYWPEGDDPLAVCITIERCTETGDTKSHWLAYQVGNIGGPTMSACYDGTRDPSHSEAVHKYAFDVASLLFHSIEEFAQVGIHLPQYFRMQVERAKTNRTETGSNGVIGVTTKEEATDDGAFVKMEDTASPQPKGYKVVRAIKPSVCLSFSGAQGGRSGASGTTRAEPETQVAVEGFWRTLRPSSIGRGPTGQPVLGKTWVKAHTRYNDKPAPATPHTRVKQPVAHLLTDA